MEEDSIYILKMIWESMLKKNFWKKSLVENLWKNKMKTKWIKHNKINNGKKRKWNNKRSTKQLIRTGKVLLK